MPSEITKELCPTATIKPSDITNYRIYTKFCFLKNLTFTKQKQIHAHIQIHIHNHKYTHSNKYSQSQIPTVSPGKSLPAPSNGKGTKTEE